MLVESASSIISCASILTHYASIRMEYACIRVAYANMLVQYANVHEVLLPDGQEPWEGTKVEQNVLLDPRPNTE